MRNCFILFASLILFGAAYGKDDRRPSPPSASSICSVLANAADYDGKEITVRVISQSNPEGGFSYGPECSHEYIGLRDAPDFKPNKEVQKKWRKKRAYQPVDLVLRGKFNICREDCFVGMYWTPYQIEVREYLSVQPAPVKPK
jgi:hypothetical protein